MEIECAIGHLLHNSGVQWCV